MLPAILATVSLLIRPPVVPRAPAPLLCDTPPEGGWASYEWFEDGISCVEYEDPAGELRLGVYAAYTMLEAEPHIRPLCATDEDEGVSCLFCDEDVPAVTLDKIKRVLDPDYVFVSDEWTSRAWVNKHELVRSDHRQLAGVVIMGSVAKKGRRTVSSPVSKHK